ncbi:hypothetical protein Lalb_Chr23g0273581 [Lupinus albus]|uniref:Uncharacterized protein n=1 Tax=Lupinus albus TaxID=3870 RepID=A0A6A4N960_LUPAL|nr:hypothetical protein Lalb_Chr23g0273581 [Lupinus albus]
MEWLSNCFVGRAIDLEKASQVPNALLSEGFHTIQCHQMGGNLILLSPVEGEDIKDLIKDAPECLNSLFSSIHHWKEEDVAEYRSTWIRCLGVPLHAWSMTFFDLVANIVGSLLMVDDDTMRKVRFDRCRLLVKTSQRTQINSSISVMINGKAFEVFVWEEVGVDLVIKESLKGDSLSSSSSDSVHSIFDGLSVDSDGWVSDTVVSGGSPENCYNDGAELEEVGKEKEHNS